jgi:hypothetical protein
LIGANGAKYDFDGEAEATYTLFSSAHFQINMQLSGGDGPATRSMTEIGLLFGHQKFVFDVKTMPESLHDELEQGVALAGGKLLAWSHWQTKLELCRGHTVTISQMHTTEPWLAHADGSPFYYLDVEINVSECDDSYDGALGQTYKCKYLSGEEEFRWSHAQEASFKIPSLLSITKIFQADSTCLSSSTFEGTATAGGSDSSLTGGSDDAVRTVSSSWRRQRAKK